MKKLLSLTTKEKVGTAQATRPAMNHGLAGTMQLAQCNWRNGVAAVELNLLEDIYYGDWVSKDREEYI